MRVPSAYSPVIWSILVLCRMSCESSGADIRFLGRAEIPGSALDRSGQTALLEDQSPAARWGGQGSGIAWSGDGNRYVMISDRGPGDGATSYRCRFHWVDVDVLGEGSSGNKGSTVITARLSRTQLLSDRDNQPLIGLAAAIPGKGSFGGIRFDPESIRPTGRGSFLIADEYGPTIREFDARGRQIGQQLLPDKFSPSSPDANPLRELPPENVKGRHPNRGMESLAVAPDGETLYGLMQGPLLQDGALDSEGKKIGTNVRLVEIFSGNRTPREYVYQLEHPDHGCSELEWLAPGRFLVIERDGKPGTAGSIKRLFEIDLSGATDIGSLTALPATGLPDGVRPVKKTLFLDLLDDRWHLAGDSFPAKIEGITLGPRLPDGSRLLLISSDNDFKAEEPTWLLAFAVTVK